MGEIGIRELKAHASKIVRAVRTRRVRYLITYRGRPVGMLLPLDQPVGALVPAAEDAGRGVWEELVDLGEAMGRGWKSSKNSTELLSRLRR
jgi:prevent-host-death family protein